jgi:PmbA protein
MNFVKYFEYAKKIGFSDVEFKVQTSNKLSISVFQKKVENYSVSENETIYIRGIFNGKMVSGSSENANNVCKILDEMAVNATLIDEEKEQEIFAGSEKYKTFKTSSDKLAKVSIADKIALCLDIESKAYDYDYRIAPGVEVEYQEVESAMKIVNSKGLKLSYKVNYGFVVLSVVAKSDNDTRTGFKFKILQDLDSLNVEQLVKDTCDDAINALNGSQCESKKYKVLLAPNVFASFANVLLSSVSGDAVNRGKSLLKDKLNQQVASSKLTIVENPHSKEHPYFYRAFDDEGVATMKKAIVEKGVLKTFLYNIEEAKQAKVKSTGNGYGGSVIGVSTSFVEVKPGKKSKEELCEKIKDGIQITNVQGLHAGMNPLSGDFSLQASGYRIENVKITTPVNLITIAGNIFKMFNDIVDLGNDEYVTPGGMSSVSVYIKSLAISGK